MVEGNGEDVSPSDERLLTDAGREQRQAEAIGEMSSPSLLIV